MQTVNINLMWWLAHGATVPEAVVVYESVSPAKKPMCRMALGPEVWVPRADMDTKGSWLGPVNPPLLTSGAAQEVEELPPPPAEIVVPVYADFAPPARGDEDELLAWDDKSEESEGSTKRRGPPATACPPEVEALLGTDKDTFIAAQTGFSLHLIMKWRTERRIPRYLKNTPEAPTQSEPVEVVPSTDELSPLVARRFPEGASDEDMATEAGVSVAKVVDARRKLGLHRPRGRKPGQTAQTKQAEVLDSELDALLA